MENFPENEKIGKSKIIPQEVVEMTHDVMGRLQKEEELKI